MVRAMKWLVRLWPLWLVTITVIVGLLYGWILAVGCLWLGISLAALVWVLRSFRIDRAPASPESG